MQADLQHRVGRNLRARRITRGLSQEAFADVIGFHRTYLGALERAECNLTLKTLERIAEQIDIDPLSLLVEPADG